MNSSLFTNATTTIDLAAKSLMWLGRQRSVYYIWIVDISINMFITFFLLKYFRKWKIYENALMFYMRALLINEAILGLSLLSIACWHLRNSFLGYPEVMPQIRCYIISSVSILSAKLRSWLTFFISYDRYDKCKRLTLLENERYL